jgi:outer membrane protein TolC
VCISPVFSQDGNVFISFDQLSEFAIKHSPEAKVMEQTYNLNVTEGQLDLQWSNPLIGYSQEFVKDQSREEREQYLIVSKQFEMPWVYSLRRKSWEFESEAAEYKKEQKLKDFIGEVKTGYADIKLMEEQVEGLNHVKKLITNVSEIAKNQLEEGAISGVEHHFIQMALFNVNSRLLQLEQKKHLLEGEWKAKIGVDETDAVYITTKIDFKPVVVKSTDYYLSLIPTTLGFQQRDKMKEAIQKRIKLERMRVFPYFDLFAGYKRINPDLNGYVVGIALPLPILNTNKPQIRKQKIERDLIESDLVSYRLQLQQQIKTKLNAIQEYLGSLEEITPQLASVKERIGRIFFSYKEGQISLVEALNATQIYSESIEQYYEQLRNYYRNIFQLEAMINRQLVTF